MTEKNMFKSVSYYGAFNERTGYGVHGSRFVETLEKLIPVHRNKEGGDVSISLLDTVTASQIKTFPPHPSILYNIWEADAQPEDFIKNLRNYSRLWVASEAQRAWSIAQGIPEELVSVVPEGVDPDIYFPHASLGKSETFDFLVVGQWQPRKSTEEIVKAFLAAFPDNPKARLYLSVDTLFPSDSYHSTEERLEALGIKDDRIIPVHFEEREDYVKRLQKAHCFVSCSRSEGFYLPGIEAMACGIPAIFSDYGGTTEYAKDAVLVRVPSKIKPFGIYGDWDVPGLWGQPDYDHLKEQMLDVYNNYDQHKAKALKLSQEIREKFSWRKAAEKAYALLEELSKKGIPDVATEEQAIPAEEEVRKDIEAYARKKGFEIKELKRRSAIFLIDCHPTTQEKLKTLEETIGQAREYPYPVLVVSHVPLPQNTIEKADFYIYDKNDILSGDDRALYWRAESGKERDVRQSRIPSHALAYLHNIRNGIDFCMNRYDWIFQLSYDAEFDLNDWMERVYASDKPFITARWEHQPGTITGQLIASKTELLDKIMPRLETWKEFADLYGEDRFIPEKYVYKVLGDKIGYDNVDILDVEIGNRFNQVDEDLWDDDLYEVNFIGGPYFNLTGISTREYDVEYSVPGRNGLYTTKQKVGMWSRASIKYYMDWAIKAYFKGQLKFEHKMDLKGKNVLIQLGSKALGDTIAWIPYVDEFRKKHDCHIVCSGWWMEIFDYPEIEFVKPGSKVEDIYASYEVGCFDNQLDKNVHDWRLTPLQKVSADILGLEYEPIRAKMKYDSKPVIEEPYICFSEFSTMQNKFWNREGAWQKVINYLNSLGYKCVSISAEKSRLENIISHNGQLIDETIRDIAGAQFYVGLNAGPTWVAYALGIPAIMITGVSEEWNDFPNPYRVSVDVCRPGCFNDPSLPIDRGWNWCGRNKDFACTREITEELVIETINKLRQDNNLR